MKKFLYILLIVSFVMTACQRTNDTTDPINVEQKTETTVPMTTYTTFNETIYTYKGHGKITITATLPVHVELSINGVPYSTHSLSNAPIALDISNVTIDGDNVLSFTYEDPYDGDIYVKHTSPVISNTYTGTEFTTDELDRLDTYINNEITAGFPGAVLLIMKNGEIVKNTAYGNAKVYEGLELADSPQPMTTETLFDLASITKVFATTFAIMKLEEDGLLNTSDYVYQYLEGFNTEEKSAITIGHLLTHTSGFGSSFRFFDPDNKYGEDFYSLDRDTTMALLSDLPLNYPTGTDSAYSDLGFITLGSIVETITGMTLDAYVEQNIYQSLDLAYTMFTPLDKGVLPEMIAATERAGNTRDNRYEWPDVRTYTLQGEVHDELAYYAMNGVSGNAGLFSNAHDLAVMAQMLLNGGAYGEKRIFEEATVDKFTSRSIENPRYCLGFDYGVDNKNYRRYSLLTSDTAFGKTGWTGTNVLIDPTNHMAVILLTNKRHTPFLEGSFMGSDYQTGQYSPIITQIYEMLMDTDVYAFEPVAVPDNAERTDVVLGIDRIHDFDTLFDGNNVGLITNQSGVNSQGISSIDVMYNNTNLVALFAPEHGIEGLLDAGERYNSTIDPSTDLPVYSLYGSNLKPSADMLKGMDVLTFDIQDVGSRFYTYIYTMTNAMEACAKQNVSFVVFDRPNPLGGAIEGNLLEDDYTSFVGMYPIPIRHGLTVGELAMYINDVYNIGCDLTVIPMENWHRELYYDDTTLTFTAPSPNMKTATTALVYPGTCLIEGTNISEGRGTKYPFELIGAPFVNPYVLADELNSYHLPGVTFIPSAFMPESSKFEDELCYGVRLHVEDKTTFEPVSTGISLLYAFKVLYEKDFEVTPWLNNLAGMDLLTIMDAIGEVDDENDSITLESLLRLFETPTSYVDNIKTYYLY